MELRKISSASTRTALEKARHYRLLNDPDDAESICRDILEIDPDNQSALSCLVLALTDQFDGSSARFQEAREVSARLQSAYEQAYLSGLISERAAKVLLASHRPGSMHDAYEHFAAAMAHFDRAEQLANDDDGNDDPILRWNSCARLIAKHHLQPRLEGQFEAYGD